MFPICGRRLSALGGLVVLVLVSLSPARARGQKLWKAHAHRRPKPPVVTPRGELPSIPAPPDAISLFDGKDLSQWRQKGSRDAAQWNVVEGVVVVAPGSGAIETVQAFGDIQLHLEWSAPEPAQGHSQQRGNSGVYFMNQYEVQVLDSFQNETYADGQASAIYGQYPPLVNACLPPGEWQTYDIVFRRPRFGTDGKLLTPAILTVFHNGILAQDHRALFGPTNWLHYDTYQKHDDCLPISLQDHGQAVRFRNIWLRELDESTGNEISWTVSDPPGLLKETSRITLSDTQLDRYPGHYVRADGGQIEIRRRDNCLQFKLPDSKWLDLAARTERDFSAVSTDIDVTFELAADGNASGLLYVMEGVETADVKRR